MAGEIPGTVKCFKGFVDVIVLETLDFDLFMEFLRPGTWGTGKKPNEESSFLGIGIENFWIHFQVVLKPNNEASVLLLVAVKLL